MNVKQLLVSTALVSTLAVGTGAALAQGNNPNNPQPGSPPAQGIGQPQDQGQRPNGSRGQMPNGFQDQAPGQMQKGFVDADLSALVEEYTGLSIDDLITANDASVDDFAAAALDAISTNLDAAVEDGNLTSDQAAQILSQQEERLTAWVNGEGGPMMPGLGR